MAMVEMRTQLAIERAGLVTLHLQPARRSSIPTTTPTAGISHHFDNSCIVYRANYNQNCSNTGTPGTRRRREEKAARVPTRF